MNSAQPYHLSEKFFAILLAAATLQFVNAHASGLFNAIAFSWIISAVILITAIFAFIKFWRIAPSTERDEFTAPWKWPLTWLFLAIMIWQIASYPPMMNDSLCYRLPRIFLWLQDGGITRTNASDGRILEMPYGWEVLALPIVAINQVTFVAIINLIAWIATLQLFHHWSLIYGATEKQAKWLSLALATAPIYLLQATSSANDLFAATCLLFSLHFILSFSRTPHWPKIFLSLIAFMMACGIKPQFLVLGLGWGAWWIFSSSKPWKHTKTLPLAIFGSLALLVSPLPVFISNYLATNSFLGAEMKSGMETGTILFKSVSSPLQFLSAQLQLPVMPGADKISSTIQSFPPFQTINAQIPKFEPGVVMIPTIDGVSFGLVHFGLLILGLALTIRTNRSPLFIYILVFVCVGFLIAGSKVVPGTIGRSFAGFIALLTPLAIYGLIKLKTNWQIPLCAAAILAGFTAMILNPSSPAWSSRLIEKTANESRKTGVADKLSQYHAYQLRAETGVGFLDPVPRDETIAILVRGFTPIAGLWTPDWKKHHIEFVHQIPPETFQTSHHTWLLIADNASEQFPEITESYRQLEGWQEVSKKPFRPLLSRDPETWTLYKRR